jgi:hypothetical protein
LYRESVLFGAGTAGEDAFLQQLAAAYSFKATVSFTLNGYTGTGGGNFNLAASGTIPIRAYQDNNVDFFPITGQHQVNYTAGSLQGENFTSMLQLPLSYAQQIDLTVDTCSNLYGDLYMGIVGALQELGQPEEMWTQPPDSVPPLVSDDYLEQGFDYAFGTTYGDNNNTYEDWYDFPVQLQNMQATAVNTNWTGADGWFGPSASVQVTFQLVLVHAPQ